MTEPTNSRAGAMPTELGEVAVWEAFRALRIEGADLYARLVAHMSESGFFAVAGASLEVGSGDGAFWKAAPGMLRDALRAGSLHLTDTDAALIEKDRADPFFATPGLALAVADIERLPFREGAFRRLMATHVLHWCSTPERVGRAAHELARVVADGGSALVVTVDERVHMREAYELLRDARAALLAKGISCAAEMPTVAPRVLPFCAGNAHQILERAFSRVQRVDLRYAHLIDAVHPTLGLRGDDFFVGYLRTLPFLRDAVTRGSAPEALFTEARRLFREHTEKDGPFRFSRCDVLYHCSSPRRVGAGTSPGALSANEE